MKTSTQPAASSKKTPTAEKKPVALAQGQGNRNTDEELQKLSIVPVAAMNPRRANTHGFRSWEVIVKFLAKTGKKTMPVATYIENGGRMKDLRWDILHGHAEVR